jgi:hypothetical protein
MHGEQDLSVTLARDRFSRGEREYNCASSGRCTVFTSTFIIGSTMSDREGPLLSSIETREIEAHKFNQIRSVWRLPFHKKKSPRSW